MTDTVLNVDEAADYLNLAPSTLAKLRMVGNGPCFLKLTSRRVGYRRSDLDAYLETRVRQNTSETD